ncbi:TPA: type II toxin-antitoxin system death-on-curing family toxin [Legionella anisa]|uniref:type II toxin-antitoxin system death-on-curing family toxin n=1 Tax=Legionella anisa TaxID=28082 RepID=UPI002244E8AE|nr:type II toxin-antitoxin system death-on-curing family toxin [Legionella anisa]MCW8425587.1 type II toxin-antitoxin system death-on-curing family toxin [Legionella anisa]MCW8448983.1 type II toxin-antitoxin system death-on-curing family toxin [Legionella anisa]
MVDIKFLPVASVLNIHKKILENTLEDKNLCPDRPIESALNRINDHVFYNNLEDIYEIAALYAIAIGKGHCFNNGNKRTAMVSMIVFLLVNNIQILFSNEEIENKMVDLVEDKLSHLEMANWIKEKTKHR